MMKTQQEWMDYFNTRNLTTNILSIPAARVSLSACDIWEIQSDAATHAELDGADKVIANLKSERDGALGVIEFLKAENLRIRKIAAHVPAKLWLEAEYTAGHARQIKTNEPRRTDDWSARERKEGLH